MIRIYRSDNLTTLASHLARDLSTHVPDDPLETMSVVVPNRDTARWLKLCLAEESGIVANISFILPAEWQFQMIRKRYPKLPKVLPGDPGPLAWSIFDVLMDDTGRKHFPRPDRYVEMQPSEIKERTVMQLSKKIASVYDQYLVYRPELILKWQRSDDFEDADEKWQAELWKLLEKRRLSREKGLGFPNKAVLIKEAIQALRNEKIRTDHSTLFFNTGLLPVPVLQMAQCATKTHDLIIYQTSLSKKEEGEWRNNLLKAFGEEAAGVDILLGKLEGTVVEDFSSEHSGDFTLHTIQESIKLDREIKTKDGGDISGIEVHSCHTPLREIEVLKQFLLRQFEKDPNLHPDDILVVMPDIETYKPVIHAVFGTGQEDTPTIPYHVDFRRSGEETTARPLLQLLDLADSRFQFSDVMDFFLDPVVHQSFDITVSAAQRLKRWMDENRVIWGLSGAHRKEEGQPDMNSQTWMSALGRGWSGIVFGEQSDPFETDASIRFNNVQGQDMEEVWAGFSHLITHFQALNRSVKMNRTTGKWCDLVEKEIDFFFSDDTAVGEQRKFIHEALDTFREEGKISGFNREISFSMFRSHLRSILDQQSASPAHFTRGVTFSSMVPVRSIPAKIIALIGLNEAEFPRKVKNIDFDLMAKDPKPYERNPKHQDRSLFLESILASGAVHYCSYIGRSRTDNEVIPPSPIVSEWLTTLSKLSGKPVKDILIEEPLHGFSADNFQRGRSYSSTGHEIANQLIHKKDGVSGLISNRNISDIKESNQLTIKDLTRFISNPLKMFLKTHFNPELNGSEELKHEFSLDSLEKHTLFERIFGWRLQERSEKIISGLLTDAGVIPAGWQGETMVQNLIQSVDTAIESARARGFKPSIVNVEINLDLAGTLLEGEILSYSRDRFLDITASSQSGDKFLRSWIKHLAVQCANTFSEQESMFVCDLKKGSPKWFAFKPVPDPGEELNHLVSLYRRGLMQPLYMFPGASYEYQNSLYKNRDDAIFRAKRSFEGSDFTPYAENMDGLITLFLGENATFSEAYLDPDMQDAIQVMLEHREELT
ncbi:exodeoxyribonuclease V subunit gamma [Rhodohalobacter sp. 8-1]|uniref:exodeoxyribonuclease V subunit gamma n=1 Tax=Rhodohalobacter sp. 8-1 TaxID=3131972 RepID=UPI0030EBCDEC